MPVRDSWPVPAFHDPATVPMVDPSFVNDSTSPVVNPDVMVAVALAVLSSASNRVGSITMGGSPSV